MTKNPIDPPSDFQALRAKAEAQLRRSKPDQTQTPIANEFLHELRVHQIELEMQNEALREAHVALEISRAHYAELYDYAPIGYLTLSPEGVIIEINLAGAKLLGTEREQIMQRRLAQFIVDSDKDRWHRLFLHAKQHGGKQTCELQLQRVDTPFYAQLDYLYRQDEDTGPSLSIMLADITGRKQAEEQQRIAAVAFETQDSIMVTDAHKVILRVNQAFTRMTGYSSDEAIGRQPDFLRSGRHDEGFYQAIWAVVQADGFWQGEMWNRRKDGGHWPAWQTISAVFDLEGRVTHYVGYSTDITVQKQAEKVLLDARQRLENQVVTSQAELEQVKQETAEINTALNVLLKQRKTDNTDTMAALVGEIQCTIQPFLKKLQGESKGRQQATRLLGIVETNLQQLMQGYGCVGGLPDGHQQLTPVEIQVASMVRQGLSTKVIADTLHSSPATISIHRKHIRKKLGLGNKASNLATYLLTLAK